MLERIKKLRGSLYGRFIASKKPDPPASSSRASQMISKITSRADGKLKFEVAPHKGLLKLPSPDEAMRKGVIYPLIGPYSYAYIKWDPREHALTYKIIEPRLSLREKAILEKLQEGLVQVIKVSLSDVRNEEKLLEFLEENIAMLLKHYEFSTGAHELIKIMYYIYRNFIGVNEIEPLLHDPYIEDIGCDGMGVPVYVVHQKYGSIKTSIIYHDTDTLRNFVTKLAERCDRYISYAEPLLDGALPDGTRVQASLASDVTTRGPTFSIRKFRDTPFNPVDMISLGTASAEMLAYLWFIVENGVNILITGGVATGKTSFLNTLSMFIPDEAKIVSIEDTRELSLPHENWIPGVARTSFGSSGVGEVTMFELLRESFRQNPDYLVVGEIRGKEAYVMFQAMASGHPAISTMHAGSIDDVIRRLQTKPINLSPGLLDALDIVVVMVHAREKGKSARRVKELVEIENIDPDTGKARSAKTFVWLPSQDTFEYRGNSWVLSKLSTEKGIPMNTILKDIARRKKLLNWMADSNITKLDEVVKYVRLYRRDPEMTDRIVSRQVYSEA
ncbi:MAG: type II/IV secretion system ATPase subunit [Candidatus Aenigmarchaeota archaeon]|nr:type II/IV secretion system ATPase subunit [Candidatus Aenigmarchaeota archaeon]